MCASSRSEAGVELDARLDGDLLAALRGYLRRYAGDAAAGEDLLQETLLRATRGWSGFGGRASLKTWLFAIASNVAADFLRDPGRRVQLVDLDQDDEPSSAALPEDERLVADEMNACVREVIDTLPPSYRSALLLHEFESMSAADVAEILGCTVATAKIRIHRGRERLRAALGKSCDFYRDREDTFRCDRKRRRDE